MAHRVISDLRFVQRDKTILQYRYLDIRDNGISDWQDVPLVIEALELPKGICTCCGQIAKFEDNVCGVCRSEPIA